MAIQTIELSEALKNLATQTNIDKVTGVYNGVPANIAKADLASVVAGVLGNPIGYKDTITPSDYDNITTTGYYPVRGTSSDSVETDYGTLAVYRSFSDNIIQIKYSLNLAGGVVKREKLTSGWTSWQRLDNFGYNSLAELSAGVGENISNVGNSFYTKNISGAVSLDNPLAVAQEIVGSLPDKDTAFCVVHTYAGKRLAYGYVYGSKLYGSIFIHSYDNRHYHYDIDNGTYTQR